MRPKGQNVLLPTFTMILYLFSFRKSLSCSAFYHLFCTVVGFNPISYTVTEGMLMGFVRLSLFRQGNMDLTANVSIMIVSGSAVAGM